MGKETVGQLTDADNFPFMDSQVNLFVIQDAGCTVSAGEIERVLAPRGLVLSRRPLDQPGSAPDLQPLPVPGWHGAVKRVPAEIDDWTHSLYDATGNMVSNDRKVDSPHHIQWMAGPTWNRYSKTSAFVSSKGRVFYIHGKDHSAVQNVSLPNRWALVARDAYSGVQLWELEIPSWGGGGSKKIGPAHISRLLVATGDRVFAVLEYGAPVSMLDAATGKMIKEFPQTGKVAEFVRLGGMLIARIDHNLPRGPGGNFTPRPLNRLKGQSLLALDVDTGATLWSVHNVSVMPTSLVAGESFVFFHDGRAVVGLDRVSGEKVWRSVAAGVPSPLERWYGVTLVAHPETVCYSCGGKLMVFSAKTGETLWGARSPLTNYRTSPDLFIVDDAVWTASELKRLKMNFVARDLMTGDERVSLTHTIDAGISHHRCSRIHATQNYMVCSASGIELLDFANPDSFREHLWARGSCYNGITPANGMLYISPHNCACFIQAKLTGYAAMAPERQAASVLETRRPTAAQGYERGPAFEHARDRVMPAQNSSSWPTYRGNAFRSGSSSTMVAANPEASWTASVGGRLSAPVVADGTVFLCSVNRNTVHALDADSGESVWTYVAGGPIDSPPTIHEGLAIFGGNDGWVYCLRATDGTLVWRRLMAPCERRIVVRDRLESPWPI